MHLSSNFSAVESRVAPWLNQVPLYQRLAAPCREKGLAFPACFGQLPLITKLDIRLDFPRNFLAADVELDQLLEKKQVELERTSGTSEESTPLLLGMGWWAEQEWRALQLNSWIAGRIKKEARRVTVVSPMCSGEICYRGVPAHSERIVGSSLVVNISRHPFAWTDSALGRMAEETLAWEPAFLDVDPVYGVLLALYCERKGLALPTLQFVLSSYEYLSVLHRRILERVFKVPVFNLYGSTETGHLIMEDGHGGMAVSTETAFLELAEIDDQGIGDLVVTTLSNEFMPLIRYAIGDLARMDSRQNLELHGRSRDAIARPGRPRLTVAQVDHCFQGVEGIVHYQLRQTATEQFLLYYVPERTGPAPGDLQRLAGNLQAQLGDGVELRAVDYLACESSGKFRLVLPRRNG